MASSMTYGEGEDPHLWRDRCEMRLSLLRLSIHLKVISFYQDRLGTNTNGKVETESAFCCRSGRFHILSHNGQIHTGGSNLQPGGDCGRHLFSATGSAGTWFGVPNSTLPNALGGCAYPRVNVTWADGSVKHFSGRERPHLIFGSDHDDDAGGGGGGGGVPVALTNAVIDSTDLPTYLYDKAYTLVQPINTKK